MTIALREAALSLSPTGYRAVGRRHELYGVVTMVHN